MFKCVFIPADGTPVQEQSKSKSGGLEKDRLRADAEAHFKSSTKSSDQTTPEQIEQVNEMLRKQGIDPTTVDKNLYSQIPSLGGACEIISLYLPTAADNFTAVSMYCDSNGQTKKLPVNTRATDLVRCCGHNVTVYGDAFIGRCHDDESKPWVRLDFTSADMSSDAPWVIEARKRNQGKNMSSYSTSGTMENFMKQHNNSTAASTSTSTVSPAVEVLSDKPEDVIKKQANNLFVAKKYAEAEELYSQAIAIATEKESLAVLLTNRSAARLLLDKLDLALADAEKAIESDPTWMKAYHRKSAALEKLNRHREAYYTWHAALISCKRDITLMKQYRLATAAWVKIFRDPTNPIESHEDLVERFQLLTDKRERMSTLAHVWNDSAKTDRYQYFQLFLRLISGATGVSPQTTVFTADHMLDLPMHNYTDLTRDRIATWCDFFAAQSNETKLAIFTEIWGKLSGEEQNDVVVDIRLLMERSLNTLDGNNTSDSTQGDSDMNMVTDENEDELHLKPTAFSKNG